MAAIDIKVPDIGDFKDVAIIELLVKPGDTIAKDQSLVTVESDKASMEIPSSHAGVVKELKVKIGDTISEGSLLLTLEATEAVRADPSTGLRTGPVEAPAATAPSPSTTSTGSGQASSGRTEAVAAPIANATCSCSVPARAVTRLPSAPPTSA